jgi:hypothetical protein
MRAENNVYNVVPIVTVALEIVSTTNAVLADIAHNPVLQDKTVQREHTVLLSKILKTRVWDNGVSLNAAPLFNANATFPV